VNNNLTLTRKQLEILISIKGLSAARIKESQVSNKLTLTDKQLATLIKKLQVRIAKLYKIARYESRSHSQEAREMMQSIQDEEQVLYKQMQELQKAGLSGSKFVLEMELTRKNGEIELGC
jgi:hypothetical protein